MSYKQVLTWFNMAILVASWLFAEELNENSWEGWLDYKRLGYWTKLGWEYGFAWEKRKLHF